MSAPRSFRARLAVRFAVTVSLLVLAASALSYMGSRTVLYQRLDGILLRLAEIEAAATADSPDESVHFHDEAFLGSGPGHETILSRYAEVWTLSGEPVVRTRNLGGRDLPLPPEVRTLAARTSRPQVFGFEWDGKRHRAVLYPLGLVGPRHQLHLLQVAASTAETETLLRRMLALLAALVVIGFGAGGGLGWWLAGYAVRPVLAIIRQAETLQAAPPMRRIDVRPDTEELQRLVAVLNAMLARLEATLEGQRRFLADAGHAIRTPLTILRGDLDVTLRKPRDADEYRRVLDQALDDMREVSRLADDLITLARSDSGGLQAERERIAVQPLLAKVAARFAGAAERARVRIVVAPTGDLAVQGDAALLERALSNLMDNAIKYGASPGSVALGGEAVPDGRVTIRVADDGPGIPAEERERVLERFYRGERGQRAGLGSGLGLAIVRAVADSHGGRVELNTAAGAGTTVSLVLPAA